ncbi:MAG TPA: FAD-binding oxidoreductase, partial [Thermoplasmatales archaeon]|nr:FAD-binding oxidoreductase [Thermoplasmatales archaeon]
MKYDVVIIGGGANGCSLAYQLSKRGLKVALFERNYICSGATGRCGAGIRQQWSTEENIILARESVKIFENLSKELGEDIGFRQGGYLIAVHDEKELKEAEERVALQKSLGVDVKIIDKDGIRNIAPILDPDGMHAIAATFCPTDGHADPFKTTFAYAKSARKYGADIFTHSEAKKIVRERNQVRGVVVNGKSIKA